MNLQIICHLGEHDLSCYRWSPQNWSPRTIHGSCSWFPGPFVALQVVPPDQLWRHGWSPFAMVGPKITPKSLISGSLFVLLCINANKMAQTALQNIATSIVYVPYASTVFGSSGIRVHTFTIAHSKSICSI